MKPRCCKQVGTTTTQDMEVWFSTAGIDAPGRGTQVRPYASYDYAMESIPENIDNNVIVKYTAGTYTSTRYQDTRTCTRNGQFILECVDPPTVLYGPYTLTGVHVTGIDPANYSGLELTVAAAGWGVDDFYRKFAHFLDGDCQDWYFPIFSNTADTIVLGGGFDLIPDVNDTFEIVEAAGIIEFDQGATFSWNGHAGRTCAQFGIANTSFQVSVDMALMYSPFIFDGDGNVSFGVVEFYGDNALTIFEQSGGIINSWELLDASVMTNPSLIDGSGYWSTQFVGASAPPVGAASSSTIVVITEQQGYAWGTGVSFFACRQGVGFETPRAYMSCFAVRYVYLDHASAAWLSNFRAESLNANAIRVDDHSSLYMGEGWVDKSTSHGMILTKMSRTEMTNCGGTLADIGGYGLLVGALCHVYHGGGCTLEGVSGKVRLDQNATTVNWPAAKAGSTDGLGSFVTG